MKWTPFPFYRRNTWSLGKSLPFLFPTFCPSNEEIKRISWAGTNKGQFLICSGQVKLLLLLLLPLPFLITILWPSLPINLSLNSYSICSFSSSSLVPWKTAVRFFKRWHSFHCLADLPRGVRVWLTLRGSSLGSGCVLTPEALWCACLLLAVPPKTAAALGQILF